MSARLYYQLLTSSIMWDIIYGYNNKNHNNNNNVINIGDIDNINTHAYIRTYATAVIAYRRQ